MAEQAQAAATARTEDQVQRELDQAYQRDGDLPFGTPEYRENRQRLSQLIIELIQFRAKPTGNFTPDDYAKYPDTFEQPAQSRKRERA